jgi:hypothetical protein
MMHSFLLIGQSNMAGRGNVNSVPAIVNESVRVLRNGRWQMMAEPIHNDRPSAGVGLASSFAASWQQDHAGKQIGLIPCADGGTSLNDWQVGGPLFDHAVAQAKLAQRGSVLSGILWHQGENDCSVEAAAAYADKFEIVVSELRHQLGVPEVPLIIGAVGDFLPKGMYGAFFKEYERVNDALFAYVQKHRNSHFVTAGDLSANEDQLHFDAVSLRKLGVRYYHAFKHQMDVIAPLINEREILETIYGRKATLKELTFVTENDFALGRITLNQFQEKIKEIAELQ